MIAVYIARPFDGFDPIVLTCYLLTAVLHLVSGLSMDDCAFQLAGLQLILSYSLSLRTPLDGETNSIVKSIPQDVRYVLDTLNLQPVTKSFVCCPKCFQCYTDDSTSGYPARCTNRETPSSKTCNRELRKTRTIKGRIHTFPSRRYHYQCMKAWLARLLCRDGFEKLIDRDVLSNGSGPERQLDIWDAPELREFRGPDGKPFIFRTGESKEGRYIFSLCMDGFNPYQMKESGKKVSTGAIYMVCLNLHPSIRYKPENMYLVGIIPGPHEPSTNQINYLLRPLIDDLHDFWKDGVHYSKTPLHPQGRVVRCAVVPLVCDLLAARQMGGFASHASSHFCSFCLQKLEDIEDLDWQNWATRTCAEHRQIAIKWRDAASELERNDLFETHGLRWTELLRLPYWDPTAFTLLDSMHALFLGNLKRHCRNIWGMDVKFEDGDGITYDPPNGRKEPSDEDMKEGYHVLRHGSNAQLFKLKLEVLRRICREKSVRFGGKKKKLVKSLIACVSFFRVTSLQHISYTVTATKCGVVQ